MTAYHDDAGSGLGSTTRKGLTPASDASDGLELRDAPSAGLDDLPFGEPLTPATGNGTGPRKCPHPRPYRRIIESGDSVCSRCGHTFDPARARMGRNNNKRGRSIQRAVAEALDMEHIPGNRPEDARDATFVAEIKSGPAWYSTRVEAELDNLPTWGLPLFVAASTPGAGRSRRVYVTLSLGDLVELVGTHAQVSTWAPEWVVLKRAHGVTRDEPR